MLRQSHKILEIPTFAIPEHLLSKKLGYALMRLTEHFIQNSKY